MLKHKIIGRNISILYRSESTFFDKQIRDINTNKIQVEILLFIKDNPDTNLTEINNYFKFNKATITKIVKHLEKEKFISTSVNTQDRREKIITITAKGEYILPEIKEIFNNWESVISRNISDEHIEITRNVLAQMVKNLEQIQ